MATSSDTRNKESRNFRAIPPKIDKSTLAAIGIDYAHHELHDGKHFFYRGTANIAASGNSVYFYMDPATDGSRSHTIFSFSSNGYCRVRIGTYTSTGATVATKFTNNRLESGNVSSSEHSGLVTNAPTGPSYFATITLGRDGTPPAAGKGAFGSDGGIREELILDPSELYVLQFEALMDDIDVNLNVAFYEHGDAY